MATRNLARSLVEGGRRGRYSERYALRAERRHIKEWLGSIGSVEEAEEASRVEPGWCHKGWGSEFSDRFAPVERFLEANAGRPWNRVYSVLCGRFDRRTLKGWHLLRHVDRHMVNGHGHYGRPWRSLWGASVGLDGILRYRRRTR